MSWWGAFKGAWNGGALSNKDKGIQQSGPMVGVTESDISVTDERAVMVSAVFACVRLLVQSQATMPLSFYERTETGRDSLDDNHYLCQLLKYQPNQFMTAKEFRQAMSAQRVLWGNGYAKIDRMDGRPVALTPLKPEFMSVARTRNGLEYTYSIDSGERTYSQDQIFHLKGFSTDGVMGLSALAHARHTLGISVSADRKAATSFAGRPSGTLSVPDFLTQEQRDKARDLYSRIGDSGIGDGQWWLLEGGAEYKAIGLPPDDLQMLESRQFQVSEICRFFGVPTVMVDGNAGTTAAWPASYEQQQLQFLTHTLKPYLEEWEDKISYSLLTPQDRRTVFAEHNVEGLLRADSAGRANFYSQMVQNGLMTRNEVRMKENLPPIDGADELTAQVNLAPVDELQGATNVAEQNRQPT